MREVGLYATGSQKEETSSSDEPQPPIDMTHCYYPELAANFMAFAVPNLILYPLSTVLNRLYVQGTRTIIDDLDNGYDVVPLSTNYVGLIDCIRTVWREEGILGFYRGFGAILLQCVLYFLVLKITKFIYVQLSQDFKGKR
jgi:solute carrier family 25 protein 46